jgi:thiamine phosphate synthase YjbQ (UPF0047 family)
LRNSPRVQPILLGDKRTEAIKSQEFQLGRYSGIWFVFLCISKNSRSLYIEYIDIY